MSARRIGAIVLAAVGSVCHVVALTAHSGVDSGGGRSLSGSYTDHGSVGSPFETVPSSGGNYLLYGGLIEVLYPPLPVDPDEDSDANGLPDRWEIDHFGAIGVDPDDDADRDGTTNGMEFLAMTDPNDSASVFRPAYQRMGNELIVSIQTQTGRSYRIWGSPDLTNWGLIDTLVGDATAIEWRYLLSEPANLPYFLRIEIILP